MSTRRSIRPCSVLRTIALIVTLITNTLAQSPTPLRGEEAGQAGRATLARGARVAVVTVQDISSKVFFDGEPIEMKVDEDVFAGGRKVFAKGANAKGRVVYVKQGASYGRPGRLRIEIESAVAVDGQEIKLDGSLSKKGSNEVGMLIVMGVAFGSLGAFIASANRGGNARIKAGTRLVARTREDSAIALAVD